MSICIACRFYRSLVFSRPNWISAPEALRTPWRAAGNTWAMWVKSLYLKYMGRAADAGGLNGYINFLAGSGTIEQVIDGLVGSAEYFARHGNNNTQFVQGLYHDILGRSASNAEVLTCLSVLDAGATRCSWASIS